MNKTYYELAMFSRKNRNWSCINLMKQNGDVAKKISSRSIDRSLIWAKVTPHLDRTIELNINPNRLNRYSINECIREHVKEFNLDEK